MSIHERAYRSREVSTDAVFQFVESTGKTTGHQLPMRLLYTSKDPHAITIHFSPNSPKDQAKWMVSRELWVRAFRAKPDVRVGNGDFMIIGTSKENRAYSYIGLSSPDGAILLRVERESLVNFLRSTQRLVALGSEKIYLDPDHDIAKLLK